MKKLIKISDYYYVIDDKAELTPDNWITDTNNNNHVCIATTNPSLHLPQITNPNDELVGKEVEIEFKYIYPMDECGWSNNSKEPTLTATIKPISKETSTNETLTNDYKRFEIPTLEQTLNKVEISYSIPKDTKQLENLIKTNETLEEVAYNYTLKVLEE